MKVPVVQLFKTWNEADHPRKPAGSEGGGQFTEVVDGEVQLVVPPKNPLYQRTKPRKTKVVGERPAAGKEEYILREQAVLEQLDKEGLGDTYKVEFLYGQPDKKIEGLEGTGRNWNSAASFTQDYRGTGGTITLRMEKFLTKRTLLGTVAHEAGHARFIFAARRSVKVENFIADNVARLSQGGQQISGYAKAWWDRVGSVPPDAPKSSFYWENRQKVFKAVNETLAEFHQAHKEGEYHAAPRAYQELAEVVGKVWGSRKKEGDVVNIKETQPSLEEGTRLQEAAFQDVPGMVEMEGGDCGVLLDRNLKFTTDIEEAVFLRIHHDDGRLTLAVLEKVEVE